MKISFFLCCLGISLGTLSQKKCYFIPGQGSDERIFDSIQLPENHEKIVLQYDTVQDYLSGSTIICVGINLVLHEKTRLHF